MKLDSVEHSSGTPKIVVIGGGTGISAVLKGLRKHDCTLTAIVTMFDSGGSSGLLRREFGYPPLGDIRQCILAMCDGNGNGPALRELFEFRFPGESSLNGHSLGNLLLGAMTSLRKDLETAIQEISRVLGVQGEVLPVSLDDAELCAELEDNLLIRGESNIDLRERALPRIRRVFLDPGAKASPRAIQAILRADLVVLGPGDLYTSVVPNLLVEGIPQALSETEAPCVYICNLMTKSGETDGFKASDFAREIHRYLGHRKLDAVLVHQGEVPGPVRHAYEHEGAELVVPDTAAVAAYAQRAIAAPLANGQVPLRHDPERLALALLAFLRDHASSPSKVALSPD